MGWLTRHSHYSLIYVPPTKRFSAWAGRPPSCVPPVNYSEAKGEDGLHNSNFLSPKYPRRQLKQPNALMIFVYVCRTHLWARCTTGEVLERLRDAQEERPFGLAMKNIR